MAVIRMPAATANAIAAKAGIRIPDPKPRDKATRIPRPELARGLDTQCRALGLPAGTPEYQFHPTRKWRTDRYFADGKLLVEIDGGSWLPKGGHSHGTGFERDRKKDAEALVLGFRTLRVTPKMLKSGEAVFYIARLLGFPVSRTTIRRAR